MTKIQEKLSLTPAKPGVYLMRDISGSIIYIGKAKSLSARLSSYFKSGSHDTKVTAMLARVCDFDYFITKTENDALGLEANLIKKHKPHYNILLKDSKTFPYIKIVDGKFPYLEVTRKITRGGKYFGPYFNGVWAKDLLGVLCDVFPLRTCGIPSFSAAKKSGMSCINNQIGRCLAPCAGKVSEEEYAKVIADVKAFLRGEREFGAREILSKKMETAAELQQFELAIRYRNGIDFLDKLKDRTITQIGRDVNCDVFACVSNGDIVVFCVMTVRAGKLIGIQNFDVMTSGVQSNEDMLGSFIMQYYENNIAPEQIVADIDLPNVVKPKAALKKRLLDMAKANAQEYLDKSVEQIKFKHEFTVGACEELARVLRGVFSSLGTACGTPPQPLQGLWSSNKSSAAPSQKSPHVALAPALRKIECYDISHTGGEDTVASMVVFIDGVAQKKLYRRFKIKHGLGNNDVMSMREVIKRRLARVDTHDESFGICPDLIVLDGGKGQLSAVMDWVNNLTHPKIMQTGIIALAKENEEIFVPGQSEPIVLSKRSYALRLLQRLRDEAHRFANEYHKKLRGSKIHTLSLPSK